MMTRLWTRLATAAALLSAPVLAQQVPVSQLPVSQLPISQATGPAEPLPSPVAALPEVTVIGAAPLIGTGIDVGKVPAATNVQTSGDVARLGPPDFLGALNRDVGGVSLDQTAGNPFQPDLLYRGFTASPQLGTNQGIAVYVNGARFNSSFGDVVNWDVIPDEAIDQLNLEGSNPVYGLNALGGSLNVKLKNGFTFQGGALTAYGGSFGRIGTTFEYGIQSGTMAAYVAADIIHDDGWRDKSSSDLHRVYGDIGWRGSTGEAHVSILAAANDLNGPGTTPVPLLDYNRAAVFTAPNVTHNKYLALNANVTKEVSDTLSVQALVYYNNTSQRVVNGNTPNFQVCNTGFGLCENDGITLLTGRNGAAIPDFLSGGPYSQLNTNAVDSNAYGVTLQTSDNRDLLGHTNRVLVGLSLDAGITGFDANTAVGGLTPNDRTFAGPGIAIAQSDLSIAPVRLQTTNVYYGAYASDVFDITAKLAVTLSGRFNAAQIDLHDQIGTSVSGNHTINRFNPGVGATYKITPDVSLYGSYSEASRAPTPAEFSCANINSPCTLTNFFTGDPNLKQIVARTFEVGVRGAATPWPDAKLTWDADLYRTDTNDDILFSPSLLVGREFFQNIGRARRQGAEASVGLTYGKVTAALAYGYTEATFQSGFTLDSVLNPAADANGQIQVVPGDRLPGIPAQQLKANVYYRVTADWTTGANAIASSGQVLFGDEANLTPRTGSYFVLNLNTRYQLTPNIQVFGIVDNVTNTKYATYGTFSQTNAVPIAQVPGASNPRALDPGAPLAGYAGVRATF